MYGAHLVSTGSVPRLRRLQQPRRCFELDWQLDVAHDLIRGLLSLSGLVHVLAVGCFAAQTALLHVYLSKHVSKATLLTLAVEVPLLFHLLWFWREESAHRAAPTQWIAYSWVHAAKVVLLFCRVMPRLASTGLQELEFNGFILSSMDFESDWFDSPELLSNLLLLTPVFYSLLMFRTSRAIFGESPGSVTVDLIMHYDMLWHVAIDMVDQVDMFRYSRLAEVVDTKALEDKQRSLVTIQSFIPFFLCLSMMLQAQSLPGVIVDGWRIEDHSAPKEGSAPQQQTGSQPLISTVSTPAPPTRESTDSRSAAEGDGGHAEGPEGGHVGMQASGVLDVAHHDSSQHLASIPSIRQEGDTQGSGGAVWCGGTASPHSEENLFEAGGDEPLPALPESVQPQLLSSLSAPEGRSSPSGRRARFSDAVLNEIRGISSTDTRGGRSSASSGCRREYSDVSDSQRTATSSSLRPSRHRHMAVGKIASSEAMRARATIADNRCRVRREQKRTRSLLDIVHLIQRQSIVIARKRSAIVSIFFVDIPFLVIRIWLWALLGQSAAFPSMAVKNVICIILNVTQYPIVLMQVREAFRMIQERLVTYHAKGLSHALGGALHHPHHPEVPGAARSQQEHGMPPTLGPTPLSSADSAQAVKAAKHLRHAQHRLRTKVMSETVRGSSICVHFWALSIACCLGLLFARGEHLMNDFYRMVTNLL